MKVLYIIIVVFLIPRVADCQTIDKLLDAYHSSHYIEKIYVAMDKPYYVLDDEIWAKVYMVYGRSHVLIDAEPIIYADWIDPDGKIVDTYLLKIKNGVAPLSIKTNIYDKEGTYKLRVYSEFQLNFDAEYIWQKEVRLINSAEIYAENKNSSEELSVQFFPEGGYLVDGLKSMVAYDIAGVSKEGDFKGVIRDDEGNIVSDISIWNHGIGRVNITPESGKKYTAELEYKGSKINVDLPSSIPQGYVISANSLDDKKLRITINTNVPGGLEGSHFIAHIRGEIVSSFTLEQSSSSITLALEKERMPSGIVHLTLFDPMDRPVAERLVFNRNPVEQVEVDLNVMPQVGTREMVTVTMGAFLDSVAVSGSANVAIYNRDVLPDEWRSVDIQSYLWLQSDLKGKIDFIGDYLAVDNKRSRSLLDLALATHGWRRFEWQKVLQSDYPKLTSFSSESTVVSGQVVKLNSGKPVKADVALNIINNELFAALQLTTDENGFFQFEGIDLPDSTEILIQAATHRKKKSKKVKKGTQKLVGNRTVEVIPSTLPTQGLDTMEHLRHYPFSGREAIANAEPATQSANRSKVLPNTTWSLDLDEVVVSTRRYSAQARNDVVRKRYREKGIFFFASTPKFLADDPQYDGLYFATVHDLLRALIPASKKITSGGQAAISLGGISSTAVARIVVNGELIPSAAEQLINPADVYSVDIITGLRAQALYGPSGIISILTRESDDPRKITTPGMYNINHPGYYSKRSYYTPNRSELANEVDYRTTVYWDPDVELGKKGHSFTFRTSDLEGIHQIVVEGLTIGGIPFVKRHFIMVEGSGSR